MTSSNQGMPNTEERDTDVSPSIKATEAKSRYALLHLMWQSYPWLTVVMTIIGVISGLASIAVIGTINSAIHSTENRMHLLWLFIGLNSVALLFRNITSLLPSYVTLNIMTALRMALCKKILIIPLTELEKRGVVKILTLLTKDIPQLTQSLLILPIILVEATIFIFSVAYLAYLSWLIFLLTIVSVLFGVALYFFFFRKGMFFSRQVRDEFNTFNHATHGLLLGIKELKLNRQRRRWFKRVAIDLSSKRVARYKFREELWFTAGGNVGQIVFALTLGFVVFGVPAFEVLDTATLTASVLILLYVMGPLSLLVNVIPTLGEGIVAYERLTEFGFSMEDLKKEETASQQDRSDPSVLKNFHKIELRNVSANYKNSLVHNQRVNNEFALGPINLDIKAGECIFIVGGNGSGKSTLAKILTGLYCPTQGEIFVDGERINEKNREHYYSLFSAVFTDFHLFTRVIGPNSSSNNTALAKTYLEKLALADKIQIDGKHYSTVDALSYGQRKRLALLCAYMEDRPIYVLDEWAADQAPSFKRFFYEVLLPELKSRGKTVIMVTHDDHYFNLADRVITLSDGRIVSD